MSQLNYSNLSAMSNSGMTKITQSPLVNSKTCVAHLKYCRGARVAVTFEIIALAYAQGLIITAPAALYGAGFNTKVFLATGNRAIYKVNQFLLLANPRVRHNYSKLAGCKWCSKLIFFQYTRRSPMAAN